MGRRAAILALSLVAPILVACAAPRNGPGVVADLAPTERPAERTDEASLWMQAEHLEEQLKTSPALVRDPDLHAYVRSIVCRVAGPHCPRIRVYVIRRPGYHASMAPNGMMQVGTGMLLRTANEAQLAYVLGHEIGHYLRRHAIQRWDDFQAKAINLRAEMESIAAFSREHEREADQVGVDLMVKSGYDPRQAWRAWERVMAEPRGPAGSASSVFLATHPPTTERLDAVRAAAEKMTLASSEPRVGREDYVTHLRPVRSWMLSDEVRTRQFAANAALVRALVEDGDGLGELHFYAGEIYRLRAAPGDATSAVTAYRRALEFPDAPAETQRGLGLAYARLGERTAAREALARYLERQPTAEDRELIEAQLADLEAPR